ncbi:hypothetical protein [Archangium primigenium]|uniref:hypothetical protein n=1 Tax=[Archangium] primigenium TaxID=2792470 RepID=UPI001EF933F7|nr:hypothetical protein [Archangium primigenium]
MLLGLLCGLWSCSAPNPNVRVERMPNGLLRVKGPLAGPFKTTEELAAHACELMTAQPGAANGAYGFEYCALHYYSHAAQGFFLSYLSDIGGNGAGGRKYCEVPRALDDESHPDAIILGAAHSHPNTRKFSSEDTSELRHWRPTRFMDKDTGRIWDRALLMFFREPAGTCSSYLYDNTSRRVLALRRGQWTAIGQASGPYGEVEMFQGQDWLP